MGLFKLLVAGGLLASSQGSGLQPRGPMWKFSGECDGDAGEVVKYEGPEDNPGTVEQQRVACALACYYDENEKLMGFIVREGPELKGRCICEIQDSGDPETCAKNNDKKDEAGYQRYDLPTGRPVLKSSEYVGYFECEGGNETKKYEGGSSSDSTEKVTLPGRGECETACLEDKDFNAAGYIVMDNGRCFCEQQNSSTCKKITTNGYARFDLTATDEGGANTAETDHAQLVGGVVGGVVGVAAIAALYTFWPRTPGGAVDPPQSNRGTLL